MAEACRVCGNLINSALFFGNLRGLEVGYFECPNCGYVQTQQPTWLDDAYSEPINASDTGVIARNLSNLKITVSTLALLGARKGRIVDCAGGYGILVRMLRDFGVDAYWNDPYATNLVAKGFEYDGGKADLVTAFEALEHFVKPLEELQRLKKIAPNILVSTNLMPVPTPSPESWWYYGLDHGQHIGFFREKTLRYLANKNELHLITDGHSIHLFSRMKLSKSKWNLLKRISNFNMGFLGQGLHSKTWNDSKSIIDKVFQSPVKREA